MHKKLKRVLHPNRYFIWTLIIALTGGILLTAFIYLNILDIADQSIFSELKTRKVYIDKKDGYSLRYPNNWQIDRDQAGNVIFENPEKLEESLSVTAAELSMESIIRKSLNIRSQKDFAKNDLKISLIKAGNEQDQESLDVAIIKNETKLFYISGHSPFIESFVRNFKIQP